MIAMSWPAQSIAGEPVVEHVESELPADAGGDLRLLMGCDDSARRLDDGSDEPKRPEVQRRP
jgi:hypothetical protein